MKNHILFRVDASQKIGWGHFYRCLALAHMLKDNFNISFAMASPFPEAKKLLEEYRYTCISLPKQEYSTPDERGNNELDFDLKDALDEIDVVILDGYWFGEQYQKALREFQVKVAIIEDAGEGKYYADLIINHAPGLKKENYVLDSTNPQFALGPEHALLRPSFLQAAREDYKNKSVIDQLLINFGGSDYFNFTGKALKWFIQNTSLKIQVVVGSGYNHFEELEKINGISPDRVEVNKNLSEAEMVKAMMNADVGILPASGVLFESIACKLPVISGTYTQNQNAIYEGFLTENVIIDGGDFADFHKPWERLIQVNLVQLRKKQAALIDGMSSTRISKKFQCLI